MDPFERFSGLDSRLAASADAILAFSLDWGLADEEGDHDQVASEEE